MLEQDEIVGAVVVFRDISERQQAEQERAKLESQLQQAQKLEAIGTLAGGIAHDFNNILMAIIGYTELTATTLPEDSQAYKNLGQVIKAGHRATALVQQILAFCRQDEGERQVVQVGPILKECLKMLHSTLPTTIEIRHQLASDGIVAANPVQLHQVIMNLCTNAYHAMRDNGGIIEALLTSVTLDSSKANLILELPPGPYMQLSITDNGQGMEPAILKRIFDPFFTTKGPGEGTGLGLSVVHGIVKNHGGAIKVYSEPGKGTVFHIFLPQIVKDAAVSIADQDEKKLPRGSEHILIVDDEETLTILNSELLESLGYEVTTFNSALDALDSFQAHPHRFDLVLTDQTMPQMTGLELAQELLQMRPDLPVILCTGYSLGVSEETVKAADIKELLMKPIINKHLAEKIRQVLDQRPS
jgi:signal transduction histidine kinase/ActR/RegA family two-component response regulator